LRSGLEDRTPNVEVHLGTGPTCALHLKGTDIGSIEVQHLGNPLSLDIIIAELQLVLVNDYSPGVTDNVKSGYPL
jgi:hypothetical protein